jgi:hypothetical protein
LDNAHLNPFSFGNPPYIWLDEGEGAKEREGDTGMENRISKETRRRQNINQPFSFGACDPLRMHVKKK